MSQTNLQNADGTEPTEQPKLTGQEKFRRGGFKPAAEVIAEAEAPPAEAPADEVYDDPAMAAAILADDSVMLEVGEGIAPLHSAPQVGEEEEVAAEEVAEEAPKFKLAGKEFQTQEEAWAYAEELEREKAAADAFRQGVEMASQAQGSYPPPQPAAPPAPKEIDPLYYTDPQAYFQKMQAEIVDSARSRIRQEAQAEESKRNLWNKFYSDYPDLAPVHDIVAMTFEQNYKRLEHVKVELAMKEIAEKTRAKLKPYIEAAMPKVALPKVKTTASPGGANQVTQPKTAGKPLNFAQQMKSLKKSRAQFR